MRTRSTFRDLDRRHPILRLLAVNGLAGATAAVVFVVGLLSFDIGGLGSLIAASSAPALPIAMITGSLVLTLSGAAMAAAIMRIGRDDNDRGGHLRPIPLRIRADDNRRR